MSKHPIYHAPQGYFHQDQLERERQKQSQEDARSAPKDAKLLAYARIIRWSEGRMLRVLAQLRETPEWVDTVRAWGQMHPKERAEYLQLALPKQGTVSSKVRDGFIDVIRRCQGGGLASTDPEVVVVSMLAAAAITVED